MTQKCLCLLKAYFEDKDRPRRQLKQRFASMIILASNVCAVSSIFIRRLLKNSLPLSLHSKDITIRLGAIVPVALDTVKFIGFMKEKFPFV